MYLSNKRSKLNSKKNVIVPTNANKNHEVEEAQTESCKFASFATFVEWKDKKKKKLPKSTGG
jgi:hypothetical protein